MTILEDLFHGNLHPNEYFSRGSKYSKALKALVAIEDQLEKTLNDEQKELFEKLRECQADYNIAFESGAFAEGFRLGAKLIMEIQRTDGE